MVRFPRAILILAATLFLAAPNRLKGCWHPHDLTPQERIWSEALRQSGLEDPLGCTPEEATQQAKRFRALLKSNRKASACATHWWLRQLAALKLNGSRQTTIVDIGCNKGYFFGGALEYLAPDYGDHQQLLFQSHNARGIYSRPCGNCNECTTTPPDKPTEGQRLVDVLCVEPSEVHVQSLVQARDALYGRPDAAGAPPGGATTRVRLHVKHGAMSNYSGMIRFPRNCTVNTCSIRDHPEDFDVVHVTTVDEEVRARDWPYLDVMKIDTEGFDPTVLAGAYRTLASHRIGVVSFEYHHLWSRANATLHQCTRYLHDLGYACFVDAPTLTKLSGGCWDPAYEFRAWSNIVCVLRGTAMEAELTAGSFVSSKVTNRQPRNRQRLWWAAQVAVAFGLGVGLRHFGGLAVAAGLTASVPVLRSSRGWLGRGSART